MNKREISEIKKQLKMGKHHIMVLVTEKILNVDELADKAFSDQCTSANPRVPLVPEIKQILLDAYYGNEI